MKYSNTYRYLQVENWDNKINGPTVDEEFVLIRDHIPIYNIDQRLTREQKREKYIGQNMYIDGCKKPEDTYFVYTCHLNIEHPGKKLYVMEFLPELKVDTTQPLNKKYKFACMQSRPRMHRILTSSWINENFTNDEYFYTANFNVEQDGITAHLDFIDPIYPGLPVKFIQETEYTNKIANDLTNDKFYRLFYSETSQAVFNIITEPEFFTYGFMITEKLVHAYLSYNIPIMHGYSACDCVKKMGFETFDDIIDYSSQYIKDPFERTFKLLNDNKEIMKNAFDVLTHDVRERIEYNNRLMRSTNINKGLLTKLNDESTIDLFKELMYNTSNKQIQQCLPRDIF